MNSPMKSSSGTLRCMVWYTRHAFPYDAPACNFGDRMWRKLSASPQLLQQISYVYRTNTLTSSKTTRFEVLLVLNVKTEVFLNAAPCKLLRSFFRFGETYCLQIQYSSQTFLTLSKLHSFTARKSTGPLLCSLFFIIIRNYNNSIPYNCYSWE